MALSDLKTLMNASAQNLSQFKGLSAAYGILLGGTPSIDGYTNLINTNNSTNFGAGASGPTFNDENIYINTINALYQGNATAKSAFDAIVASAATIQDALTLVYNYVIPAASRTQAGLDYFKSQASFYASRAAELGVAGTNGTALVAFASLTKIAVDNDIGGLGDTINDLKAAVDNGTAAIPQGGDVFTPLETADGTQFDPDDVGGGSNQGQTFTLTTGVDAGAAFTGGTGNDTFNANPGASNAVTFTALDSLDGGAGSDILNVSTIQDANNTGFTLSTAATVKNIETLNLTVASDNVGDTLTADVSSWTGLTTANFVISGVDSAATITTKGNVTSVSVTGSVAAGITDSATTDTLASVTATDATGLVTVTSDKLTKLVLNNSDAGATVTAAAGARVLELTLNGIDGGTVADAEATTLNVVSSGTKTTAVTLNAAKATTVTVDAAVETVITDVNIAAATSLTTKGAGAVTVSALSTVTALTSIDSSASTGGLSVGAAIGNAVTFKGGAGKDSVIVGATTKAITTAGGDDTVTVAGVSALGTGGSIDAGEGTDTLKFSTYANAVTASAATTFAGTVSGFERLELSGANGAAGAVVNLANLDNINYVTLSATNTATTTISNMASGGTIVFKADQTAGQDATVAVTNANTGTSDVLNVVLSKATALAAVELIAADVETINITSTETATTLLGNVTHALELNATAAKSLVVSGNAGVTFGTLTGATALTSIDASGVTAGLVSLTTAALANAATIKGGAGANTVVASAATKAVTYTGQDKVDTITINNAQNNIVTTAAGDDVIVTGSGADTIDAGAGNDTITSGTGLDQITGGAGNDIFNIVASANGNIFATIKDATAGDKLSFTDLGTETFAATKLTLGGTAVFQDYLNLAAAGDGGTHAAISWFQFGGNTYVVQDVSAGVSFVNGTDMVVELTGLINLATATGAGTNVITLA